MRHANRWRFGVGWVIAGVLCQVVEFLLLDLLDVFLVLVETTAFFFEVGGSSGISKDGVSGQRWPCVLDLSHLLDVFWCEFISNFLEPCLNII